MSLKLTISLVLAEMLLLAPVARAAPPENVKIEINFLLGYIESSGCEFYRNGSWRDSKSAQAHIGDKYKYLMTRNLIDTTEDFIESAATKSNFTGQPYKVRCNGVAIVSSNQWLYDELTRFRMHK